jgi:SM-20-related protein
MLLVGDKAASMDEDTSMAKFELNAALDRAELNAAYREKFRLHVENVLSTTSALALLKHVSQEITWRSFLISEERMLAAPPDLRGSYPPEVEKELSDCAYAGAHKGFACLYDATRLFAEDIPEGAEIEEVVETPVLAQLSEFVNSESFLELIRTVTDVPRIGHVAIQAVRFRPGHFGMFHAGTHSADKSRKRIGAFSINLTPEWRPEWGGLLEFRSTSEFGSTEAFVPTFNSLDLFGFPQGHWISCVAPFAGGPRLSVSGRLYSEPP